MGADWTGGRRAGNSAATRYTQVPAVDKWDSYGKAHDLALARAKTRSDLLRADAAYAAGAISDGVWSLNPLEVATGVAVGTLGTVAHQWSA